MAVVALNFGRRRTQSTRRVVLCVYFFKGSHLALARGVGSASVLRLEISIVAPVAKGQKRGQETRNLEPMLYLNIGTCWGIEPVVCGSPMQIRPQNHHNA
jgi:hypothetical protein